MRANVEPCQPLKEATWQFRRDYVLSVISSCGGSKRRAAKVLQIKRYSLYRILARDGARLDETAQTREYKKSGA